MSMTPMQRGIRWAVIIAVVIFFMYIFRGILAPYFVGIALAYFLDPLADWFEKHGFKRIIAVTIITLVAAVAIVLFLVIAVPLAFDQLVQLVQGFPGFFERLNSVLLERFPQFADLENTIATRISQSTEQIVGTISEWVLSSTSSLFSWIGALFIVPTVGFYMLYDWDRVARLVDSWVPRDNLKSYRYLTGEIDKTLSGFVRGQGSVCLIMASYYSISLTLVGLNFGFVIGLIAGFLTFIPIIGGLVGGLLVIGVGFFQYVLGDGGNWLYYVFVLVVYYAGQTFEGNFLTPRLVGGSVGLHPVWVMFALSAGAALAGFTGMIVAVPVAAVIGVMGRYLLNIYRHGPLYLGHDYDKVQYEAMKRGEVEAATDG